MQVDAAPAQPADVPPPAPAAAVEDASEEETEVSRRLNMELDVVLFYRSHQR